MKRFYGAYGSNVNIEGMLQRCPNAELVGISLLKDHKLVFRGEPNYSYLSVEEDKDESVPLAIWLVDKEDEDSLDYYEGYPDFYFKETFTLPVKNIQTGEKNEREVFIYIMDSAFPLSTPSADYLKKCSKGYSDLGFSLEPLKKALNFSLNQSGKNGHLS